MSQATGWTEDLPPPSDNDYGRVAALIYRHTGIRLGAGKAYFIVGRLGPLYRSLGCSSWKDLCDRLESRPEKEFVENLVQAAVTKETQFFRDVVPFRALTEKILPEVAGGGGVARIWSAGCSTGQEPYSIAFSLWSLVERGAVDVSVWATDICRRSLRQAEEGIYSPLDLSRGLDPEARRRFFVELPRGSAQVRSEVRRKIRFEPLNLLAETPRQGGFHAVFCRNVAIYFDREGKARLYESLGRCLVPGGYLILGAAETMMPAVPGFETVYFDRCLLFRKVRAE